MKTNMEIKGQALVEMAIVLLLLFLLVFGIFQFGWLMYIKNTLNNAARAGARAGVVMSGYDVSTNPTGLKDISGSPVSLNNSCSFNAENASIYQTVCNSLFNGVDKTQTTVEVILSDLDSSGSLTYGDLVTVKVTMGSVKGFVAGLIAVPNTVTGEASMRYE